MAAAAAICVSTACIASAACVSTACIASAVCIAAACIASSNCTCMPAITMLASALAALALAAAAAATAAARCGSARGVHSVVDLRQYTTQRRAHRARRLERCVAAPRRAAAVSGVDVELQLQSLDTNTVS